MRIRKFAAIDIGSNAIRLLIQNVIEEEGKDTKFKKSSLIRVPIRLGQDAFTSGKISDKNISKMIDAIQAFKLIMKVNEVEAYMACATSAMRESKNGTTVRDIIYEKTKVFIEIIDGKKEAEIITLTDLYELMDENKVYLYVDVGGGSTEFTVFFNGKVIHSKSFKIGSVRLLNKMEDPAIWQKMEEWIKKHTKKFHKIAIIASGGSINKLFKISRTSTRTPLSYLWLNAQYQFLKETTYEERVRELGFNPDRADIIVLATKIYLSATEWSRAKKIYIPKIGLSDGIIKLLYQKNT